MGVHKDYEVIDGEKFYSVTTCIHCIKDKSFENTRNAMGDEFIQQKMDEGTALHDFLYQLSAGQVFEYNQLTLKQRFVSDWYTDNVIKVVKYETDLYSKKYHIKGRPDLIAVLKGDGNVLVDLKGASESRTYKLQMAGYNEILKENGIEVDYALLLHCTTKGIKQVRIKKSDLQKHFNTFLYSKELYIFMND